MPALARFTLDADHPLGGGAGGQEPSAMRHRAMIVPRGLALRGDEYGNRLDAQTLILRLI